MAQDLRKLLKEDQKLSRHKMPKGHESRFLEKLDEQLPEQPKENIFSFNFLKVAASVVILLGLAFIAFKYLGKTDQINVPEQVVENTKSSIEDVSPGLKKVEDYYLASINSELSKIKYTPETKELFDSYIQRLGELTKEYDRLAKELVESGPNENTVNALIDNLKLRLNLLHRLKEKLSELNNEGFDEAQVL
jgi:hypothetical protein